MANNKVKKEKKTVDTEKTQSVLYSISSGLFFIVSILDFFILQKITFGVIYFALGVTFLSLAITYSKRVKRKEKKI